jgi:pilus assembly protein CpaC
VINLAKISNLSLEYVKNRISADPNFPQKVSIRTLNGMLILDGTVESEAEKTLAIDVAKLYVPDVNLANPLVDKAGARELSQPRGIIQALIKVVAPKQEQNAQKDKLIRVTVHFVELTKDYNKIFGFTWRPGFTSAPQISIGQDAAGDQAAQAASFSATLSNLFPKLQSAQNAGYARVIKSGTLIVRNGQPADMSENTRFPITIFSAQNGQVSASGEDVGLAFSVTPAVVGQTEDVTMDLDLNQKSLVGRAPAAGQAPITSSHRVKTKIFVKNGESAAVVGVNSGEVVTQFNKDDPSPGSFAEGTEPLFSLNRSKQYAKKKSQFVIFVTPQIIESAHEGTEDLQRNFRMNVN